MDDLFILLIIGAYFAIGLFLYGMAYGIGIDEEWCVCFFAIWPVCIIVLLICAIGLIPFKLGEIIGDFIHYNF